MKPTVKNNPRPLWDLSKEVAPGFVRLTRRGKLFAYLLLASHYDEEDIGYLTDAGFWQMINERRNERTIPWEQVKDELLGIQRKEKSNNGAARTNGRKKGKHRNGPARD
jgi:hypothetical protein